MISSASVLGASVVNSFDPSDFDAPARGGAGGVFGLDGELGEVDVVVDLGSRSP